MIRQAYHQVKATYRRYTRSRVFYNIYKKNLWSDPESLSGGGSSAAATEKIRGALPDLLLTLGVRSIVDAPCGDFHWMKELRIPELLDRYYGIDIVPQIIKSNQDSYPSDKLQFKVLDLVREIVPRADLVLCRHLLIHLPLRDCLRVLRNFKKSGARYLLITTQPEIRANKEILFTGGFRPLNLEIAPFHFPHRRIALDDAQTDRDSAELALYELQDIVVGTDR
jgi:hypothetical protein